MIDLLKDIDDPSTLEEPDRASSFVFDAARQQASAAALETIQAVRGVGLINGTMVEGPAETARQEIDALADSRSRALAQRIRLRSTQLETFANGKAATTAAGKEQSLHRTLFRVLLFFLAALVGLTVLFASGVLRFGLAGPYAYVVYVIAGLLVAVVCFGLLSSTGDAHGNKFGYEIRIGGALVGFFVAAGGGMLFETYGRAHKDFFSFRVLLVDSSGNAMRPTGTLTLYAGARRFQEPIDTAGSVLYYAVPSELEGTKARLVFDATKDATRYVLLADEIDLPTDDSVKVKIRPVESPSPASVSSKLEPVPSPSNSSTPARSLALSTNSRYESDKEDELALMHDGEEAFAASDYEATIRYLNRAKTVQRSGVWQQSYPYLYGAQLLAGKEDDARATKADMLNAAKFAVANGHKFLSHAFGMGTLIENMSIAKKLIPDKYAADADGAINQLSSFRDQIH